jgi:hypothetical protein
MPHMYSQVSMPRLRPEILIHEKNSSVNGRLASRAVRSFRTKGVVHFVRTTRRWIAEQAAILYVARIRNRSPLGRHATWNGVAVAPRRRLLDSLVPEAWIPANQQDDSTYEGALVRALKRTVTPGDRVIIVGGGYGVTVVTAARETGSGGSVLCYEAAQERISDLETALRVNPMPAKTTVEHCIVSEAKSLFGTAGDASILDPAELPVADVLQLDCEGAEVGILRNMQFRPRIIVVETHGIFEAPTPLVRQILEELGYAVEDLGLAEERYQEYCAENDIRVLVGRRSG